jgi:hypothetical protein
VSLAARASVTAGFANDVDEVNQYAAVMYAPTANGTAAGRRRTHPLRGPRPHVAGRREDRLAEHRVSDGDAGERPEHLGRDVDRDVAPPDAPLPGVGERHRGVEVRAGHRPEGQDQGHQPGAGRDGVRQERDRHVAAGEALSHDAGSDDGGEEEGRPERLGRGLLAEINGSHGSLSLE